MVPLPLATSSFLLWTLETTRRKRQKNTSGQAAMFNSHFLLVKEPGLEIRFNVSLSDAASPLPTKLLTLSRELTSFSAKWVNHPRKDSFQLKFLLTILQWPAVTLMCHGQSDPTWTWLAFLTSYPSPMHTNTPSSEPQCQLLPALF